MQWRSEIKRSKINRVLKFQDSFYKGILLHTLVLYLDLATVRADLQAAYMEGGDE